MAVVSSARHEAVQSGKATCPDTTRPAGPRFEGAWDPALKDILVPGYVGLNRNGAVEYDYVVDHLHPPPGKYPVLYVFDYDEAFLHYDCPGCAYSGWADSLTVLAPTQTGLSGAATAPLRIRAGFIGNALRLELPAGSWRGDLMTPRGERVAAFEIGPHSKMPAEVRLRRRLAPGAYILTVRGREGAALRRILSAF